MTSAQRQDVLPAEAGGCIADRYDVRSLLGRGGMASVYRVLDRSSGREIALKQLHVSNHPQQATVAALFEREFHTLAQLRHPSVITVYDYGFGAGGAFYTMELLDGGDLRDRAPLPWREACALLFDVCSSLALLHSRRLLHRDVSPRNVRCTPGGRAKLIDFGAMGPMLSGGAPIVGTPAFTPPETVHRSALDGRSDLFSLGATFYFALTGQLAHPARTFSEALASFHKLPVPPSARVAGIPAALDELVLSLLHVEPALRPRSAYEVMQQLAAIAELDGRETEGVSAAYLMTPVLVGRDELLVQIREHLASARAGRGAGILLRAAPGLGRSRLLDACALEAKTLGVTVLRAAAPAQKEQFGVARALIRHLRDALPSSGADDELAASDDLEAATLAFARRLRAAARSHPLLVAVDDVQRIDDPSAAVLAALVDAAKQAAITLILTALDESGEKLALEVLERRTLPLRLQPLTREQTHALFGSVFGGEVANLDRLVHEIEPIARGNPRECLELAQHLIDRGLIRYAGGSWSLPSTLSPADLPHTADEAVRAKLETLSPDARFFAEAHALAFYEALRDEDYRVLRPELEAGAIADAVAQLLEHRVLTSDGASYALANRVWRASLQAQLAPGAAREVHAALMKLYTGRSNIAQIHHAFAAGRGEDGLAAMIARDAESDTRPSNLDALEQRVGDLAPTYLEAIALAERLGRPSRQLHDLRRWATAISVAAGDAEVYWQAAPAWLAQLEHDSGLLAWRADPQRDDAGARLGRALQGAFERFQATPESDRVYPVDEAIRLLAEYVAYSIAIGVRTFDVPLLSSLPGLLEPFAPLSPLLHALWQNVVGAVESNGHARYERARSRWIEAHRKLGELQDSQMQHLDVIRNAIAYAIALVEAVFGLESAETWCKLLERDPYHRLSALYARKIVRLEQGDWSGAERLRRQAELLALQQRVPQMFNTSLTVEVAAHANAWDLAGLKQVVERQEAQAARYPGWIPYCSEARARFELLRGDLAAAKSGFETCIAQARSSAFPAWVAAQAGLAQTRFALGEFREGREGALEALAICSELGVQGAALELRRTLALLEGKLGELAAAVARLDGILEEQAALGTTGLRLGMSYEARARLAIWAGDAAGYEHFARLTAREYRHGAHSPLSARYERLKLEAQRHGLRSSVELSDFDVATMIEAGALAGSDLQSVVTLAMQGVQRAEERPERALRLVCQTCAARAGHLYMLASDGPVLTASYGAPAPPELLLHYVREFLQREHASQQGLTELVTGTVADLESERGNLTQVEGTTYELLLLACSAESGRRIAGVIAMDAAEHGTVFATQAQLLATLAEHLVRGAEASEPAGR